MMSQPVVHFEVIGRDPSTLRRFYTALFGWEFGTGGLVSAEISKPDDYGFLEPIPTGGGSGIAGGVGGGEGFAPHILFYVGVPDVEAALGEAERLGATRVLGPSRAPGGGLVIGQFTDPEGNLVGVAGAPAG